jgi:lipopolysaccharide export system protein LptA
MDWHAMNEHRSDCANRASKFMTVLVMSIIMSSLCPSLVSALSTDRDQPVSIEADWAEADDLRGISVYKGKVLITQGSLKISGDEVTMYFDDGKALKRMVAVGRLARFQQKPDGKAEAQRAKANRIVYEIAKDTMILTGNAQLAQGADKINADRIVYDTLNARIKGESRPTSKSPKASGNSSGRVRITINPKKLCKDGTRRTRCPE